MANNVSRNNILRVNQEITTKNKFQRWKYKLIDIMKNINCPERLLI